MPLPSSPRLSSLTQGEIELARADAERAGEIFDACRDSVLTLHESGRILNLNTAAQKTLGYPDSKPQPRILREVVHLPGENAFGQLPYEISGLGNLPRENSFP